MYVPNCEIALTRNRKHGVPVSEARLVGGEVFVELDDATIARLYEFMLAHKSMEVSESRPYSADVRCGSWPTSVEAGAEFAIPTGQP